MKLNIEMQQPNTVICSQNRNLVRFLLQYYDIKKMFNAACAMPKKKEKSRKLLEFLMETNF